MRTIETETYTEQRPVIVDYPYKQSHHYTVYFNAEQIINDLGVRVFKYETVKVDGDISYEILVSAIVKAKYSDDDVTAILLNAALDKSEERYSEYQAELKDLQQWRKMAKEVARQAIQYAEQNMLLISLYSEVYLL